MHIFDFFPDREKISPREMEAGTERNLLIILNNFHLFCMQTFSLMSQQWCVHFHFVYILDLFYPQFLPQNQLPNLSGMWINVMVIFMLTWSWHDLSASFFWIECSDHARIYLAFGALSLFFTLLSQKNYNVQSLSTHEEIFPR